MENESLLFSDEEDYPEVKAFSLGVFAIAIIVTIVLTGTGFYIWEQIHKGGIRQVAQEVVLEFNQDYAGFTNITEMEEVYFPGANQGTKIYLTQGPDGTKLVIADTELTHSSREVIFEFSSAPVTFGPNSIVVIPDSEYVLVRYSANDAHDILIFNKDGRIVTSSVLLTNSDLGYYRVYFDEIVNKTSVRISLEDINGTRMVGVVDLQSGRIVQDEN